MGLARVALTVGVCAAAIAFAAAGGAAPAFPTREYRVPAGTHPHDVAPARDGGVWYTAQATGALGHLDPKTGKTRHIRLGAGSSPHGVIVGPDGAPWITDGGLNAIVRVDPKTEAVRVFRLPASSGYTNLNTAVFDRNGVLWFTGQGGIYGSLRPRTGALKVFRAPRGLGPYGITAGRDGFVYYASLAGSYLGRIDPKTGKAAVLEPPTEGQGARRAWADSRGRIWVSEWNAGQGREVRPGDAQLARVAPPGRDTAGVLGLRRRPRHRVADGLRRECNRALRPTHAAVPQHPPAERGRRGAAAARPPLRALGRGVGGRQAPARPHLLRGCPWNDDGPPGAGGPSLCGSRLCSTPSEPRRCCGPSGGTS